MTSLYLVKTGNANFGCKTEHSIAYLKTTKAEKIESKIKTIQRAIARATFPKIISTKLCAAIAVTICRSCRPIRFTWAFPIFPTASIWRTIEANSLLTTMPNPKSTVEQIRQRFDNDVERFSNLETGQSATIDAPLALELVVHAACATKPDATEVLDVGCGAGNYTLKLLELLPDLNATLMDLSGPMLDRAKARVETATSGQVEIIQADVREWELGHAKFDFILAAAVLHHLRGDDEWKSVFEKFFRALKPGGSVWIVDLITHSTPAIQDLMWRRYGDYLTELKNENYREEVFAYIEQEDTPRPLMFQLDLLREVGFERVEILHKNSCFAAFGGLK